MSSIRMKRIVHSYGEHTVLEDFSIDIQNGEFISVIDGSGSGKTTVLKLVSGLLVPDRGKIYVQDKAIRKVDQDELRRNTGYVIQGIGLFPHMTIEENIDYVPSLTKQDSTLIQERVKEMMGIVKLGRQLLTHYPDELSGGQKQRVGIARALASHPKTLLMDEPFGAVDEITRRPLQDEALRAYHELHITTFFITHDTRGALHLGTRVMVMKDSNVEQFDTPDTARKQSQAELV